MFFFSAQHSIKFVRTAHCSHGYNNHTETSIEIQFNITWSDPMKISYKLDLEAAIVDQFISVAEMNQSHSERERYGADGHVGHATTPGFPNPSPAPPYAAPYVVHHPDGTARWSTGLCHCTDDPANCLITCCCPCITFGQIAEIVSRGSSNCAVSGTLYSLLCLTGLGCLYSCAYRSRLRGQYDLEESPCADCLVHFCCEGCSLCQEYRELKKRGLDMGIGWEANVDRQRRGVTVPPVVGQGMTRLHCSV